MLGHHKNELRLRLERVIDVGCAEIRRSELLRWFGQERVTKAIWRSINDMWVETCDDDEAPLFVGGADSTTETMVFIWGAGLSIKDEDTCWFKSVDTLAK